MQNPHVFRAIDALVKATAGQMNKRSQYVKVKLVIFQTTNENMFTLNQMRICR